MNGVVVTGAEGFLGWHTSCWLRAQVGIEPVRLGREDLSAARVTEALAGADTVIHLAGVNRATDDEVEQGNIDIARVLAEAIRAAGRPVRVVYANSVHATSDSAYGRGKSRAAALLVEALDDVGGSLADVRLPNLFGEHGRPSYNSFVATFAHAVAHDLEPTVASDREIGLLHAHEAVAHLWAAAQGDQHEELAPASHAETVSGVLRQLQEFHALYARTGELPDLSDPFRVDLFNTYRSHLPLDTFPMHPTLHADARGELVETSRSHGGTGQSFVSVTRPGQTRGNHYHLRKVERFFVVQGQAEIGLRRLLHDEVVTVRVGGDRPGFVDMPTLWVHNIRNVGESDLVTVFWTNQLLDPQEPDQWPEVV